MDIWVGKVLSQTSANIWVQVHDFWPPDEPAQKSRGRLIATIGISQARAETDITSLGREIINRIQELYFGQQQATIPQALSESLQTLTQEFAPKVGKIEVTAAVIAADTIHIAVTGGGVWTKRQDKEGWVVYPASNATTPLTGTLVPGQFVVLGNSQFWQSLPLGLVKASIDNEDRENLAEALSAVLHGQERAGGSVGVVISALLPRQEAAIMPIAKKSWTNFKFKLPEFKRPIYLHEGQSEKSRKWPMYIGLAFVILVMALTVGWNVRQKQLAEKYSAQSVALDSLLGQFREAKALVQLNPVRSRQLLAQVQSGIAALPEKPNPKKPDPRLAEIERDLPQVLGAATGTVHSIMTSVLDLGLVRSGMQARFIKLGDEELVALDIQQDRIVTIDPTKKKGEVIAGQEALGKTQALATYPGKIVVLSNKGLVQCVGSKCSPVAVFDAEWGSVVDMGMFGGNIYVLTPAKIWRHQVTDVGFSAKQDWLAEGEDSGPLTTATSMAIDGSIWVSGAGGLITKYTRGVKDNFVIGDLDKALGAKVDLYTDADSEKLYILDAANGRVVVVAKTGEYDRQYLFDQAKNATSLVVDEKTNKFYVLAGAQVWEGDL